MFQEESPLVVKENYQFPLRIENLTLTQTKNHITGKNLVFITQEYGLYMLEYVWFTARRPQQKEQVKTSEMKFSTMNEENEEDEEENKMIMLKDPALPLYDGQIPLKDTNFLSYGQSLKGL